jgi:DNA ligase (NAD+)
VAVPGDRKVALPARCPSCSGPVRQENDFLLCAAPERCPDAQRAAIAHFCKVVDIQGFGEKLIAQAYDKQLLRDPVDLYALKAEDLAALERMGDKSASNLIGNVDAHRAIDLATFLRALGIDELGQHVAAILAERFGTLEAVRAVTVAELAAIHSIGETIATSVVAGLAAKGPLIARLLEHVQVSAAAPAAPRAPSSGRLAGQSFVFTGKLLAFERATAQQKVRALGGEAPSGVTKALTYLVIGDGQEEKKSSKQLKAEKLVAAGAPLRIIGEQEFLALIGAEPQGDGT